MAAGTGAIAATGLATVAYVLVPLEMMGLYYAVWATGMLAWVAVIALATAGISELVRRVVLHRATGRERA